MIYTWKDFNAHNACPIRHLMVFLTQNAQKWLKMPKMAWMPRKEIFGHVRHVRCLLTCLDLRIEIGDFKEMETVFYARKTGKGKFVNL